MPRQPGWRSVTLKCAVLRAGSLLGIVLLAAAGLANAGSRVDELIAQSLLLEPDSRRGKDLYREHCRSCHGRQAWGRARDAIPALAGQRVSYLIKQFADFSELDREVPEMHRLFANAELAQPQAHRDLAAYLNQLPINPKPQHGAGDALRLGGRIYDSFCRQCHGASGAGAEAEFVPSLRGQNYAYVQLQIRAIATGHRFDVAPEVMDLMAALSVDELAAVADFVTRLEALPTEESPQ
jgi:cytochrome c553